MSYRKLDQAEPGESRGSLMDRITAKAWNFWIFHRSIAGLLAAIAVITCAALAVMIPGAIINTFAPMGEGGTVYPFGLGSLVWGILVLGVAVSVWGVTAIANDVLETRWEKKAGR